MSLETATYISGLDTANPAGGDPRSTADDHIRLIKAALKRTFPNVTEAVSATATELNLTMGLSSTAQDQINSLITGKLAISATALTASSAVYAQSATNATSAVYAYSATNANYAASAGAASNATLANSALYAISAMNATSAYNANSAVYAYSATNANYAASAGAASNATLASRAISADNAGSAVYAYSAGAAGVYVGAISVGQVDSASAGGRGLVELATNDETSVGSSTSLAITPASLLAGLGKSAGNPGWVRLPGGIIIQWGTTSTVSSGSGTWVSSTATFALTFPNGFLFAVANTGDSADAVAGGYACDVLVDDSACTTSTIQCYIRRSQNAGSFAANYIAIGY